MDQLDINDFLKENAKLQKHQNIVFEDIKEIYQYNKILLEGFIAYINSIHKYEQIKINPEEISRFNNYVVSNICPKET